MEIHRFGEFLVSCGEVTDDQVLEALDMQRARTEYIGAIAIKEKIMSVKEVMSVLREQAGTTKRFGELALELGMVDEKDLGRILKIQDEMRPYLGDILVFTAFCGLASANWIFLAACVLALGACYGYRIRIEEKMLREVLGEPYVEYERTTRRLLPGIL